MLLTGTPSGAATLRAPSQSLVLYVSSRSTCAQACLASSRAAVTGGAVSKSEGPPHIDHHRRLTYWYAIISDKSETVFPVPEGISSTQ